MLIHNPINATNWAKSVYGHFSSNHYEATTSFNGKFYAISLNSSPIC